jgi:hypothetical protein
MAIDLKAVNKPLAGKPVWVWGVVGGVAVLGYYYWNSSHKAALAAAATATSTGGAPNNAAVDAYPTTSNGSFTYGAPADYSGSNVVADAGNALGNTNLETNISWVAKGVLITGGGTAAKDALNAYLAGKPITPQQAIYVTTTKTLLGNPPQSPSLAIQLISNAVPVAKTTNSPAKVNAVTKKPIVSKPKTKTVAPAIPRDTANKEAAKQAAAKQAAANEAANARYLAGNPNTVIGNLGDSIIQADFAVSDLAKGNLLGANNNASKSIGSTIKAGLNSIFGSWY